MDGSFGKLSLNKSLTFLSSKFHPMYTLNGRSLYRLGTTSDGMNKLNIWVFVVCLDNKS